MTEQEMEEMLDEVFRKVTGDTQSYPRDYVLDQSLGKGTMNYVLKKLTPDQQVWLTGLAKHYGCETMAEVILELVRDAHALEEVKK